jgi:hypothetical protein
VQEENTIIVTISSSRANQASFVAFIISSILFGIPFGLLWGFDELRNGFTSFLTDYVKLFIVLVSGMILHEGLHALTFAAFCKNGFRSVNFGIKWKHLSPYVHCREILSLNQYRLGTLMPGLILGIIPTIIGVASGNAWLLIYGVFFTAGAAGDFLSLIKLNGVDPSYRVKDHPDDLGFILIR